MIIAIDGPSGTGKSTVAKEVAKRLGFAFFDTGAMYRSLAWKVLKANIHPTDHEAIKALLPDFRVEIGTDSQGGRTYRVDGVDITQAIRDPKISSAASQVAIFPEVRASLVPIQRAFGLKHNAVFEGRDMGSVVFPDADLKIFLTASSEVRVKRRYKELLLKFPDLTETLSQAQLLKEMQERDEADSNRKHSPLKQADDAILIDTSLMTVESVVEKVLSLQRKVKPKFLPMKPFYRFIYTLARLYFKIFFRLKIYGLEHFRTGSGVIVSNHTSFFDPPVLSISWPEEVHFLGKASLFRVPLFSHLIRALNTHPIARGASDAATFRLMLQLLGQGKKMILFPEGNRSFDGKLQPLQRGLSFLIQKAKVPIFPAYIEGAFEAWPRTNKLPRLFGKIRCIFGPPLDWEDFAHLSREEAEKEILQRTDEAIRFLKNKLKAIP